MDEYEFMIEAYPKWTFTWQYEWHFFFNNTHREKLNSLQKFVKTKFWLLLIFLTCLQNQLKFVDGISQNLQSLSSY